MTKKKKSPKQQQPSEDIPMADNKDIMVIIGIKMKYLSLKENEYGHNHFFNVLDITPLQDLIELRKSLKKQIWDYNAKFYLKINDVKLKELPGEHVSQKDVPYIVDLTFSKYGFEKKGEQITGYSISEINKTYYFFTYIYIYIQNGVVRTSFKTIVIVFKTIAIVTVRISF